MKIGVLLSGSGVYDGSEIQEAVFTLLAIEEAGAEYVCIAPDVDQHHVINHLNGEEMNEKRNVLIESARIARGDVKEIKEVDPADIDALVLPGGFGAAKNLTSWAFKGPDSDILPEVKLLIVNMVNIGKPICALCVTPTVIAKALEGSDVHATLTFGTSEQDSPYDINGFHEGIASVGAETIEKKKDEIQIDQKNRIISAPCYMMEQKITEVRSNIKAAIYAIVKMVKENS